MKRFFSIIALLCVCLPAQAFQTFERRELPAPVSDHYCRDSSGKVSFQREECGHGTTEVSGIVHTNRDGTSYHLELGATMESDAGGKAARPDIPSVQFGTPDERGPAETAKPDHASERGKRERTKMVFSLLAFAVVSGLIAKVFGRSFLLWSFLGAGLYFMLVSFNVIPS
jgi:hypothetical protein